MAGGFSIRELAERSGVPVPTIRYWLRREVLPEPPDPGMPFGDTHLRAIRLARLLRARRRMPLGDIAAILPDLLRLDPGAARSPRTWDELIRRRTDRSRRPEARITQAAVRAFSRHGYTEVSMEAVGREAAVAKGSLYRHFHSKDALFLAAAGSVVREAADTVRRRIAEGSVDRTGTALAVAEAIGGHAAILLDLVSAAVRQRSKHERAARSLLSDLIREVEGMLPGGATPQEARQVVETALAHLISRLTR